MAKTKEWDELNEAQKHGELTRMKLEEQAELVRTKISLLKTLQKSVDEGNDVAVANLSRSYATINGTITSAMIEK